MMVNKGQDKIEFVCRDHSKRYVVCNKIYGTAEPLLQERQGKMTVLSEEEARGLLQRISE